MNFEFFKRRPFRFYNAFSLCDVTEIKNSRFPRMLTPAVYNFTWMSWLNITIALNAYWTICIARNCHEAEITVIRILDLLRRAAVSWEINGTAQISWSDLSHELSISVQIVSETSMIINGWCITWIALAVALAVLLLRMLNQILCKRELDTMVVDARLSSPIWQELEAEFKFLCRSSSLVTLSIISQLFEAVFQMYTAKNLVKLNWRIASAIVTQLPGVFMTPALLVQSWRILTERSDESKFQQVPLAFEDQALPQMTSHILGWDTTAFWDNETELETVNFPGLCEAQSIDSQKTEDNASVHKQATRRKPTDDISVPGDKGRCAYAPFDQTLHDWLGTSLNLEASYIQISKHKISVPGSKEGAPVALDGCHFVVTHGQVRLGT
ncbi:uncharacterized protein MELLADRAFT_114163 [Melampsora larici-populina 98AG31]|uniref:Uncharacterized protein n=1 Tax=Melampsora larici-populina (strain 98AG31 / pathotype 3-4-7) TaxID=747676 RepID=F4SCG2_MELLP|nr:uncharacterized protein MELLADRAFT_114163 [Melampsora larici-populina 98AG31]EGF97668.1 hypothetical protein MELLADRAFT_114163 [Melampsora larici-populina 98AG31]